MKRERRQAVAFRLNERAHKSAQILAKKLKRPFNSLLVEALNDLLVKYDRKPVAKEGILGRPPTK